MAYATRETGDPRSAIEGSRGHDQLVISREELVAELDRRGVDADRTDQAHKLPIQPAERGDLEVLTVLGERQPRLTRRRVVLDGHLGAVDDRAVRVRPGRVSVTEGDEEPRTDGG